MGTTTLRLPDEKLRLIRAISGYENIPLSKIYEGLTDEYISRYRETRDLLSLEGLAEKCRAGLDEIRTEGGVTIRELNESRVRLSTQAGQEFLGLNSYSRNKIISALSDISEEENPAESYQIKKLTGDLADFFRLRSGNHTVLFTLLEEKVLAIPAVIQTSEPPA